MTRAQSIVGFNPAGRPETDYYPTPEAATLALLAKERFVGWIWEPACGQGSITKVLQDVGHQVIDSDLHDYGQALQGVDFLKSNYLRCPNIITNPPYKLAQEFVQKAIDLRAVKAAFLLKLTFLEGIRRRERAECQTNAPGLGTRFAGSMPGGGGSVFLQTVGGVDAD